MMVAISNCCFPLLINVYIWKKQKKKAFYSAFYTSFVLFFFITIFLLYEFASNVLLCILFIIDDEFVEKQHRRASKKAQRKDFVQRMHARNGNACFF
jgi:Trk-type K+ transport system membrane component